MTILLAARGFPPEQRGSGYLFLTAPPDELQRAYDDILAWLEFSCRDDYHTALSTDSAKVLCRGKNVL